MADTYPPEASDADLVLAIAEGKRDALGLLFDRHGSAALALAERMLGSGPEAEELLHDVFVDAWKLGSRPDAPTRIRSWLLGRVRRRALDRLESIAYARLRSGDRSAWPDADLRATGE